MFEIVHVAICCSNIDISVEFYRTFGFTELKSWKAEDSSMKIKHLTGKNGLVLELFCPKNAKEIPSTALDVTTDLQIVGCKHFALGVDDLKKAKKFVFDKLAQDVVIKTGRLGKSYFFVSDPDGIQVEVIEN